MWRCDKVGGLGEHVTWHLFGFLVDIFPFLLYTWDRAMPASEHHDVLLHKDVPFGVALKLPHIGGRSNKKKHFCGTNRHFQV